MYINSPGGAVTAGLAMYDTMQVGDLSLASSARPGSAHAVLVDVAMRIAHTSNTAHLHPSKRQEVHKIHEGLLEGVD